MARIESVYQIASESFAGNVYDIEIRVVLSYLVCDSSDEVGLTHSGRTVDEERIVVRNRLFSAVLSDRFTAGKSKFI